MAIVQVSRITNRKGLAENLPQRAGAELGWAIDDRRLFIGNGTLQEGAPAIGNTEILTEYSDILAEQSNYTYKGLAAGYQAVTGPNNTNIVQTAQSWLDQYASVKDFGAVGDGVADDTDAINRAMYQLYCREINTQIRRALFFPAGVYRVSESVLIPSYARLVGEGANSSRIVLDTTSDDSSLFPYVARYADSLQQIGINIGNNGATAPTNIEIASMGFETNLAVSDVFLVEDANFCTFTDVSFRGPFVFDNYFPSPADVIAADISAIRFSSSPSFVCSNITFRRCEFSGLTTAFDIDQRVKGIVVAESAIHTLYRGFLFNNPGSGQPGAAGFRITGNSFDIIHQEGILAEQNQQLIFSGYNIFYNVGNGLSSPVVPSTPVISFIDSNNVSLGDMFERSDQDAAVRPRIDIHDRRNIAITNGHKIQLGSYTRESGIDAVLQPGVEEEPLFTVDAEVIPAFKVEYTIIRDAGDSSSREVKTGTLTVVGSTDGTGSNLVVNDAEFQNREPGFFLNAKETGGIITVNYSDDTPGPTSIIPGRIRYSISYLA